MPSCTVTSTHIVLAALCMGAVRASANVPGWPYQGFQSFPSMFFGANASGLDSHEQLEQVARYQLPGWGWQVGMSMRWPTNGGYPPAGGGQLPSSYSFDSSALLHQNVKNLRAVRAEAGGVRPPPSGGVFVYRNADLAVWYNNVSGREAYRSHPEHFAHSRNGSLCWYMVDGGPVTNFSLPAAVDYWLANTVQELCEQKAAGGADAVFWDGVDDAGGSRGEPNASFAVTNCSWGSFDPHWSSEAGRLAIFNAHAAAFVRAGRQLNACGVWPILSLGSAMDLGIAKGRGMPATDELFLSSLDAAGVKWARFYEFWGWNSAGYWIENALQFSRRGIPMVMHCAGPGPNGPDDILMAVASFLVVQTNYSYFGCSGGAKLGNNVWTDPGWVWHPFYDEKPGHPLGPAVYDARAQTLTRAFQAAVVTLGGCDTLNTCKTANISMATGRRYLRS